MPSPRKPPPSTASATNETPARHPTGGPEARGWPMTVLVTGGTGFVGSHTAACLAMHGRSVRLLVRNPAKISMVPALYGATNLDVVVGDVADLAAMRRVLA